MRKTILIILSILAVSLLVVSCFSSTGEAISRKAPVAGLKNVGVPVNVGAPVISCAKIGWECGVNSTLNLNCGTCGDKGQCNDQTHKCAYTY